MSTTLANINNLVNDRRRDNTSDTLDMTQEGFRAINGALQIWDETHDWEWQIAKTTINYNEGVDSYLISSSLAYKAILDVRPQRLTQISDELEYLSNNRFDSDTIHSYKFAIKTEAQNQYLRLKYVGNKAILNSTTTLSDNGTWIGATAISNVSTDKYESFNGDGSIKFDYSGTTGTLTNSDMQSIDVSRYAQRSTIYFDIYLQDVSNFTSITLKVGSSSNDYITGSITTDHLGNQLVNGYNKCKLVWDGNSTVVGTLDNTAFNYIQVTIAYSSSPSTVSNRIENFFISENIPMTLEYYSHNMAIDVSSSNALLQIFNDSSATTDTTLWSGRWDFVNEAFVNSTMEIINWINGDSTSRDIAIERIGAFVEPLKARLPSRRRYPVMTLTADVNL